MDAHCGEAHELVELESSRILERLAPLTAPVANRAVNLVHRLELLLAHPTDLTDLTRLRYSLVVRGRLHEANLVVAVLGELERLLGEEDLVLLLDQARFFLALACGRLQGIVIVLLFGRALGEGPHLCARVKDEEDSALGVKEDYTRAIVPRAPLLGRHLCGRIRHGKEVLIQNAMGGSIFTFIKKANSVLLFWEVSYTYNSVTAHAHSGRGPSVMSVPEEER